MSKLAVRWSCASLMVVMAMAAGCQSTPASQSAVALPHVDVAHIARARDPDTQPANEASAHPTAIGPMTPSIGTPAVDKLEQTKVWLTWSEQYLIVVFTCWCDQPPYSPYGKTRDALHYQGDAVEVFIDPVGDGRQYFEIQVSPDGGIFDQNTTLTADPKYSPDGTLDRLFCKKEYWPNPGYDLKGLRVSSQVTHRGDKFVWTTDLFLPAQDVLKRLGKSKFEPMTLRMNFMRYHWTGTIEDKNRRLIPMNWSPVVFGCPHLSADRMGYVRLTSNP